MSSKNFREDKNFKIDLSHAKSAYRKKRFYYFITVFLICLGVIIIRIFVYSNEKKTINTDLQNQNIQLENLDKENKANNIVINKLKDPKFIADMARSEYGLSYEGEIIFKLPEENYLDAQLKAVLGENLDKQLNEIDNSKQIDDTKVLKNNKETDKKEQTKENDKKETENADNKKNSSSKNKKTN